MVFMMVLRGMVDLVFLWSVYSQTDTEVSLQVLSGWNFCVASYSFSLSCVVG